MSAHAEDSVKVKDPVCGMMVDPATARGGSFEHAGHTYYFCNSRCAERFRAEPAKYLSPEYKPAGMQGMIAIGGIKTRACRAARSAAPPSASKDSPVRRPLHLSHGSGSKRGQTRRVPDLRHGA